MINQFYLAKSDRINLNITDFTTYDKVADEICKIVSKSTDFVKDAINKINEINKTNYLPFDKLIKFNIITTSRSFSVIKADVLSDTVIRAIVNDSIGHVNVSYNQDKTVDDIENSYSTVLIKKDSIISLELISVPQDVMHELATVEDDDLTEEERKMKPRLKKILNELYSELFSMFGSGRIRDFITKFNIEMKKYNKRALYTENITAYNKYIDIWTKYSLLMEQIITDWNTYDDKYGQSKFIYVESDEDIQKVKEEKGNLAIQKMFTRSEISDIILKVVNE